MNALTFEATNKLKHYKIIIPSKNEVKMYYSSKKISLGYNNELKKIDWKIKNEISEEVTVFNGIINKSKES